MGAKPLKRGNTNTKSEDDERSASTTDTTSSPKSQPKRRRVNSQGGGKGRGGKGGKSLERRTRGSKLQFGDIDDDERSSSTLSSNSDTTPRRRQKSPHKGRGKKSSKSPTKGRRRRRPKDDDSETSLDSQISDSEIHLNQLTSKGKGRGKKSSKSPTKGRRRPKDDDSETSLDSQISDSEIHLNQLTSKGKGRGKENKNTIVPLSSATNTQPKFKGDHHHHLRDYGSRDSTRVSRQSSGASRASSKKSSSSRSLSDDIESQETVGDEQGISSFHLGSTHNTISEPLPQNSSYSLKRSNSKRAHAYSPPNLQDEEDDSDWEKHAAAFLGGVTNETPTQQTTDNVSDNLALAGAFLPFLACNTSYRTRNALLLYSATGALLAAGLRRSVIPADCNRPLVDFFATTGVDGRLLHDLSSVPLVMGSRDGLWMFETRAHAEWEANGKSKGVPEPTSSTVAVLVLSRSRLPVAHSEVEKLTNCIHEDENLISQMSAVVSALWATKRNDISPWAVNNNHSRAEVVNFDHASDREIAMCLLSIVPLAFFASTPPAIRGAALLANPAYTPPNEQDLMSLVTKVLAALGLTRTLLEGVYNLIVPHPYSRADSDFKHAFVTLHNTIRASVGSPSNQTQLNNALESIERLLEGTARRLGYVVDSDTHTRNPSAHLLDSLRTLANTFHVTAVSHKPPHDSHSHVQPSHKSSSSVHPHRSFRNSSSSSQHRSSLSSSTAQKRESSLDRSKS